VKHYMVIESGDCENLETSVEELINEGWNLIGGVSIAPYTHQEITSFAYVQALTKESFEHPKDYPERK